MNWNGGITFLRVYILSLKPIYIEKQRKLMAFAIKKRHKNQIPDHFTNLLRTPNPTRCAMQHSDPLKQSGALTFSEQSVALSAENSL